jgi:hypothetical protein
LLHVNDNEYRTSNVDLNECLLLLRLLFRLSDLYDRTRRQYVEIENEYERFRLKQFSTYAFPKQFKSLPSTSNQSLDTSNKRRQRSHSFEFKSRSNTSPSTDPLTNGNLFDVSSASIFKTHLSELKSRIHTLTTDCSLLNDKLDQSEQDKSYLIDRITQLERQRRDDTDSLQNELTHCRKLLEKSSHNHERVILSNFYSPPEHDLSLYDEVLLENKSLTSKSSYQPTNYKDLFARVYDKLKTTNRTSNNHNER